MKRFLVILALVLGISSTIIGANALFTLSVPVVESPFYLEAYVSADEETVDEDVMIATPSVASPSTITESE